MTGEEEKRREVETYTWKKEKTKKTKPKRGKRDLESRGQDGEMKKRRIE